jgi:hypothetical protein
VRAVAADSIEVSGRRIFVKPSGEDTGISSFWTVNWIFRLEKEVTRLKAGGRAYAPRMIPHTWQPAGGREVKFLSLARPAGHLEAFLVELSKLQQEGRIEPALIKSLFERHEMEVAGPPLQARA